MSFDWPSYVCACGHWASDHVIPADEEQPASAGPCVQKDCLCWALHRETTETSATRTSDEKGRGSP